MTKPVLVVELYAAVWHPPFLRGEQGGPAAFPSTDHNPNNPECDINTTWSCNEVGDSLAIEVELAVV